MSRSPVRGVEPVSRLHAVATSEPFEALCTATAPNCKHGSKARKTPRRLCTVRPLTGSPQGLCHRSGGFNLYTASTAEHTHPTRTRLRTGVPGPPAACASLTVSALVYLMLLLTPCGAKNISAHTTTHSLTMPTSTTTCPRCGPGSRLRFRYPHTLTGLALMPSCYWHAALAHIIRSHRRASWPAALAHWVHAPNGGAPPHSVTRAHADAHETCAATPPPSSSSSSSCSRVGLPKPPRSIPDAPNTKMTIARTHPRAMTA